MSHRRRNSLVNPCLLGLSIALGLGSCARAVEESQADPASAGWVFTYPGAGRTGAKSLLDLRSMNEAIAGEKGFVRLSPDGSDLVLGDGSRARFWAVGSEVFERSPEEISRHVRFLAGMGVNMARLHAQIAPKGPGSNLTDVDEKEIDGIWRFVAEAKKQGIYTTISPYWLVAKDAARWGIEGIDAPGSLFALLFFDETLQRGYKAWARALYARPNPYTGVPLARDPAVAIIQVQNEDSLLFWSTDTIKPIHRAKLAAKFAAWLAAKYGSIEKARAVWDGTGHKDDDLASGRIGLVNLYAMTVPQSGGMGRRVSDQAEFYATTQRNFYAAMVTFYRDELGCGQLINASNWRTANQARLDDSERWSYEAAEVLAVNRYYNGGSHVGANSDWRVEPGHHFSQRSVLMNPRELPTNLKQAVGRPMIVSESTWVAPLAFQSEGPFLVAVYQSLTGLDAFYWFAAGKTEFDLDPYFPYAKVEGQRPLFKWTASTPMILGGFPAAALLYRKGLVKQGEPVVHEERTLRALWDREPPLIAEDPAFDPLRDRGNPVPAVAGATSPATPTAVDPMAFLVGPVEVKYDGDPSKTRVADLARSIDRDKKVVRSITGEITLDYGVGLCTLDAPAAQGACGFLARAGLIRLRDVSIRSSNAYATVFVVAMDDKPLDRSRRVLVQVTTAARPTGWATRDADFPGENGKPTRGFQVVNTGNPPWRIADSEVGLSIKNTDLTRATRLDTAGFPAEDVPVTRAKTGLTLTLPPETMYLILE